MSNDEKIAEFTSITGATATEAQYLLEASDWQVEAAVQLYFETSNAVAEDDPPPLSRESGQRASAYDDSLADLGGAALGTGLSDMMGDEVRRPDEVRRERLFEGAHAYGMYRGRQAPPSVDMPLRNFRQEQEAGDDVGPADRAHTLASIYRPPEDMMDDTPVGQLKMDAEAKDKWMLVNVQSQDEFASHQLNADLWGHSMIKEVVKGNFVFAQRTVPDAEAESLVRTYDLQQLPAVFIVDPHTLQKMIQWSGLIQPDRFLEDILPFLDVPPSDPAAGGLMHAALKHATFQSPAPPVMGSAGVPGLSDEDENLTRAITASLQTNHGPAAAAGGAVMFDDFIDDDEDEDALLARVAAYEATSAPIDVDETPAPSSASALPQAPAQLTGAELQAAAAARLPAEPAASTPGGVCKVAFRLPNNERGVRTFLPSDSVQALYDFVLTKLPEDVAHQAFVLVEPRPGVPPLEERSMTLQEAKAAGAMFQVKWID